VTTVRDDEPSGPPAGDGPAVRVIAYLLLLVLGALQALIGTFQFSRGPAWSLVAICFALAILVTCVLGGWGMHTAAGGVLPAAGWFLVSVLLGTSSAGGSVLVTNTPQGKWFLFGGAVCAAAGAIISFAKWTRPRARRRAGS
jgi:Family of unknown function (DUF6113)